MTEHKTLALAMLAAQAEMSNAKINAKNPHFKNTYANFNAVREAVVPILTENGVVFSQATCYEGETLVLKTTFTHALTGEAQSAMLPIPATGKPQDIGSAITYFRRYTLSCLAGIASEEDDDGQSTGDVKKPAAKPKPTPMDMSKSWAIPIVGGDLMAFKTRFCEGLAKMATVEQVNKAVADNKDNLAALTEELPDTADYVDTQIEFRRAALAQQPLEK